MSNKKETIIEHWLYMWFSPKYRIQMMLEKGETVWIEHKLYELEHNFSENTSASLEEFERKWKQIYRTTLRQSVTFSSFLIPFIQTAALFLSAAVCLFIN